MKRMAALSQGVLTTSVPHSVPRWLHAWALATLCAAVPLLLLGADVTSRHAGMADPVWPTYPWHLALVPWLESGLGFLIEHGHRAFGYLVGMCVIVLSLSLWYAQPRRWLKWLGGAALLAVVTQGLLGGFRVRLNALVGTDLALVHGCFAQLVFALFASLVTFTSADWDTPSSGAREKDGEQARSLRFWSALASALVFAQLVLGGILRHTHLPLGQWGHLLLAFAVVAVAVRLYHLAHETHPSDRHLARLATMFLVLLAAQIPLGIGSWMIRFGAGAASDWQAPNVGTGQDLVRTGHFVIGSAILATSVVVTLWAFRLADKRSAWAIQSGSLQAEGAL